MALTFRSDGNSAGPVGWTDRRTGMFANGTWDADSELWPIATFIKRITDLPPAVRESLAVRPKH